MISLTNYSAGAYFLDHPVRTDAVADGAGGDQLMFVVQTNDTPLPCMKSNPRDKSAAATMFRRLWHLHALQRA